MDADTVSRPATGEKCGRSRCGHGFGLHWESYDGTRTGCSYKVDHQRDPFECSCEGFAIVRLWGPGGQRGDAV